MTTSFTSVPELVFRAAELVSFKWLANPRKSDDFRDIARDSSCNHGQVTTRTGSTWPIRHPLSRIALPASTGAARGLLLAHVDIAEKLAHTCWSCVRKS